MSNGSLKAEDYEVKNMEILERAQLRPSKTDTWFAWYPVRVGAISTGPFGAISPAGTLKVRGRGISASENELKSPESPIFLPLT